MLGLQNTSQKNISCVLIFHRLNLALSGRFASLGQFLLEQVHDFGEGCFKAKHCRRRKIEPQGPLIEVEGNLRGRRLLLNTTDCKAIFRNQIECHRKRFLCKFRRKC
jgi:hypothetical protein